MLKLITWNIQSARTAAGGTDTSAVVAALDRFSDCDILCLQEVACGLPARDGSPAGDQFSELAARLPGYRAVACLALDRPTPWRGGGSPPGGQHGREGAHGSERKSAGGHAGADGERLGSMVFSRHPVLQVLRHSLPWPADPDVPSMPRCALEATLATPDGPLRVVCVHLEYFSSVQRLAQVGQLRTLQHEAVQHARHQRHPRTTADASAAFAAVPRALPAVFLGDFNMLPESSEYALLQQPFTDGTPALRDCWRLAYPDVLHAPTVGLHDASPGAGAPFTFDFAFASTDLGPRVRSVTVCGAPTGSDHQPLLLELG